jgi:hypothetical protein
LLFTSIEVPHRNHTYDAPIVIQNDQIWQIAFAHDFSDLIHSLRLEAVALPYLHYTVNIRVLAEIRGGDCLCRNFGHARTRISHLRDLLTMDLSYWLRSRVKLPILRLVL